MSYKLLSFQKFEVGLLNWKFYFTVRKDPRKYARVKDLLTMNEELKKARKAFDEVKYAGTVSQ